jgi:hypothetical protein
MRDLRCLIGRRELGRDAFDGVIYKGFLFPIGHRASLVKRTGREFACTAVHPIGNR